MAGENNALEMRFTANIRDIERELKRLQQINDRAAQRMAQAHQSAASASNRAWERSNISSAMQRQMQSVGAMVARYAPMIAGLFAGREALNAAESWTRFSNSLRVAGVQGAQMAQVQSALYDSAIRNGVALEPLGQLYSRLSQSQSELGANQAQLLQFTNGVTAALRVQGADAGSASGALLQLSQALASGTVRAEEFNSVNEGARPILEAVARGSDKYGGSVAKLRAAVLEGKVSSQEFFQSFLNGSGSLEAQASQSVLTVGQSMTNLHTALTRYIGEADASMGVTARISQGLAWLANNLDTVAESLKIVGALYASTFIPALGRAGAAMSGLIASKVADVVATYRLTTAQIAMTASMTGMSRAAVVGSVAMRGLQASMAFLGGPIGIAIIGITAALGYLGVSSAQAAIEASNLSNKIAAEKAELENANQAASKKRAETGNLTATEYKAAVATASLTGEVSKLKDQYYMAAAAAKTLAVEQARVKFVSSVSTMNEAQAKYEAQVQKYRNKAMAKYGPTDPMDRKLGIRTPKLTQEDERRARGLALLTPEGKEYADSVRNAQGFNRLYKNERDKKLDEYKPAPVSGGGSGKGGKTRSGGGSKATPTDNNDSVLQRADDALFQARQASAVTEEERNKVALEALQRETDAAKKAIDKELADGNISAATAEAAKAKLDQAAAIRTATEAHDHELALRNDAIQLAQMKADLDAEDLRLQADELQLKAEGTNDIRLKHKYEREALTLRQQADDAEFKVQQDQLALDRERLGLTQDEIKALREKAERNRNAQKANENQSQDQQQANGAGRSIRDQLIDYAGSFGSINDQLSNIAKQGIADISSGLADAVMGAKSFKEAFSDMAKAVIKQLIEMAVRFLIFEALGMAFGVPGLGKAALGIGHNASGTDNWRGGLTMVGESGPELVALPRGSQVMPNNLLRNAAMGSASVAGASGHQTFTFNTTFHAQDAVLTDQVTKWIHEGNMQTLGAARTMVPNDLRRQSRNTLAR